LQLQGNASHGVVLGIGTHHGGSAEQSDDDESRD
jgi:hypothetical protein